MCVEDFYRRFWAKSKSDEHYMRVGKALSLVWGVAHIVMAILFMQIERAQVVGRR